MHDALHIVRSRLDAAAAVPNLHSSVVRHGENLEKLASTLRSLGMDGQEIDRSVLELFEEYERELLRTVAEMSKGVNP